MVANQEEVWLLQDPASGATKEDVIHYEPSSHHPERTFRQKLFILVLASLTEFFIPLTVVMFLPALPICRSELNASQFLGSLTVAVFSLMFGFFPLIWGWLSDRFGRRPIMVSCMFLYSISSAVCGLSWNMGVLIGFRALQAASIAAMGVVGNGIVSDVVDASWRGRAMGLFGIPSLVSPVVGPILGGVLTEYLGWRSVFYFMAIASAPLAVLLFFFLPETLKQSSGSGNPLRPLVLLLKPPIFLVSLQIGLVFGAIFFLTEMIPDFVAELGYNSVMSGLSLLPFGVGCLSGTLVGGYLSDFAVRCCAEPVEETPTGEGSSEVAYSIAFEATSPPDGENGALSLNHPTLPHEQPPPVPISSVLISATQLWPSLSACLLSTFASLVAGAFLSIQVIISVSFAFLAGLAYCGLRPGFLAFLVGRCPQEASSVSAALASFQFLVCTLLAASGPPLADLVGMPTTFALFCGLALIAFVPLLLVLMYESRQ